MVVLVLDYCTRTRLCCCFVVFFFKHKTAYEMRISDWSSDVCSSDLNSPLDGAIPRWEPKPRFGSRNPRQFNRSSIAPGCYISFVLRSILFSLVEIGRASCRERVCQYV